MPTPAPFGGENYPESMDNDSESMNNGSESMDAGPESMPGSGAGGKRGLFMVLIAALDQVYWVAGTLAGALAGALIPFEMKGVSFALTALFVVLMIEQIKRIKKPGVFIVSAAAALFGVFFFPLALSILVALALALVLSIFVEAAAGRRKA